MLARIQQLIAFILVSVTLASATTAIVYGRPWLAAVAPLVLVIGYVAVLAGEFTLLWFSYRQGDPLRPVAMQLLKAWKAEALAAPRAFLWRQPFFARHIPDHLPTSSTHVRGVVLVHGFFCNRGLWNPWLRRLQEAGVPFVAVSLEPVFGSIDDYRATIAAAVERLRESTSRDPVVVAHSMGGLAVRKWLATEVAADVPKIHRLVTIATPHAGTRMAGRSHAANIAQMRVGSPWLEELQMRESPAARERFTCFWSHCDNIVFPTRHATLAGADNRHLAATAHVEMVQHPAVIEEVLALAVAPPLDE